MTMTFSRERAAWILSLTVLAALAAACGGTDTPVAGPNVKPPPADDDIPFKLNPKPTPAPDDTPIADREQAAGQGFDWGESEAKVKFKSDADKTLYSLKYKPDGAKLVDGATPENELARFTINGLKLKVKDPADAVLGYVVRSRDRYKIESPDQKTELFKFIRQGDGDWKLEDGADKLIYKIKKREYGYEIEDAAEKSLYKIKLKDGKTSIRDAADKTVAATKEYTSMVAVVALAFDAIEDQRLRAALAVAIEKSK